MYNIFDINIYTIIQMIILNLRIGIKFSLHIYSTAIQILVCKVVSRVPSFAGRAAAVINLCRMHVISRIRFLYDIVVAYIISLHLLLYTIIGIIVFYRILIKL